MKILIFNILIIVISICSYAQGQDILIDIDSIPDSDQNRNDSVYIYPFEKEASFPGGIDSLKCMIENYWDKKIINSYQKDGWVLIQFTIDSLGKMQDLQVNPDQIVKLATQINFITDKRIIDQIYDSFKDLPIWEPSSFGGKNVKSRCTQMVKFPYEYQCQND